MKETATERKRQNKGILRIMVNQAFCKGCEICVAFCPKEVLIMEGGYPKAVALDNCTECYLCEMLCPDFAITVDRILEDKP